MKEQLTFNFEEPEEKKEEQKKPNRPSLEYAPDPPLEEIRRRHAESLKKKLPEKTLEQIRKEEKGKPSKQVWNEFLDNKPQ